MWSPSKRGKGLVLTVDLFKELASAEESQETEEPSNKNTDEKEEELKMRKTGIIAAANELLKNSRQYLEKVFPFNHKNYG